MRVVLKFDFDSKVIFIPDGYVQDIQKVQVEFFEWLYDQSDNYIKSSEKHYGVCYDSNDFINYLNNLVLNDSNEKAYVVNIKENVNKSKIPILKF